MGPVLAFRLLDIWMAVSTSWVYCVYCVFSLLFLGFVNFKVSFGIRIPTLFYLFIYLGGLFKKKL